MLMKVLDVMSDSLRQILHYCKCFPAKREYATQISYVYKFEDIIKKTKISENYKYYLILSKREKSLGLKLILSVF